MLMTRRVLSVIFALNSEISVEIPRNHITDALAKPPTKKKSVPSGRVALNAPSIIDPSIKAWGLNQVTTQAVVTTFAIGIFTSVLVSRVSFARTSPWPIHITIILPINRIAIYSHGDALMTAPIPKKQANPKVTSKNITIKAVA